MLGVRALVVVFLAVVFGAVAIVIPFPRCPESSLFVVVMFVCLLGMTLRCFVVVVSLGVLLVLVVVVVVHLGSSVLVMCSISVLIIVLIPVVMERFVVLTSYIASVVEFLVDFMVADFVVINAFMVVGFVLVLVQIMITNGRSIFRRSISKLVSITFGVFSRSRRVVMERFFMSFASMGLVIVVVVTVVVFVIVVRSFVFAVEVILRLDSIAASFMCIMFSIRIER